MPRFIVKRHEQIKDDLRWRTGVVLENKELKTTALIRSDDHEKLIDIQVTGEQKRDFFAIIRNTFYEIHKTFEKLDIIELVPLPDYPDICIEYAELIGYEQMRKDEYLVGKLRKIYSVSELLNGIEKPEQRQQGNIYNIHGDYVGEKMRDKFKVEDVNNKNGNIIIGNDNTIQPKSENKKDDENPFLAFIKNNKMLSVLGVIFILAIGYFLINKGIITKETLDYIIEKLTSK